MIRYKLFFLLIAIISSVLFQSCEKVEPAFEISTDEFIIPEGFTIEAIAAEPLLDSPLDLSFDEKGRIWVVELPGYMRDIDGNDENKADGRIVVLTDKNGDGIMDEREVIMNDLVAPRTFLNCYGGLLYSNGTSLWFAKLDDKKVVEQTLVDSLYVIGGNIEHQPNNLFYHVDNWIYSANSNARYRYKNGKWLREATLFRGQWGMTADDEGHLYYNNNSLPLATDYSMPNQLIKNPYQQVKYSYSQAIATSRQLFPYQATSVNRGYVDGVLDSTGKVKEFTSACSPLIYHGDLFPHEYYQNAFVCAPEANLIKRYILKNENGKKVAVPAYDSTDFLISKDETFRPINLYNAPDGSMYILDLRKGVIQHRAYMSSYLREEIEKKGLDSISGLGRIYRLVPTNEKSVKARKPIDYSNKELVKMLNSHVASERNFAQQHLVFRQAKDQKEAIEKAAKDFTSWQNSALWTLEGLDILEEDLWSSIAVRSGESITLKAIIRTSELFPNNEQKQLDFFDHNIPNTIDVERLFALRFAQMSIPKADTLLLEIIKKHGNDAITCEYIISGSIGKEEQLLEKIQQIENADSLKNFLKVVIKNKKNNAIQTPQLPKKVFKDNRTAGLENYNLYCAACHNSDGKGKENLAPPLLKSEYVGGSKERLIALTLVGLQGPITVNGKRYELNAAMPGIKNNPALTDKDIADLLSFMRSSFTEIDFGEVWISPEDVAKLRAKLEDRDELFTEEELLEFEKKLK
ncbi:MAG: c-type cytochrome [Saprospiraceae bacterium]